jgi:hypothetical protein
MVDRVRRSETGADSIFIVHGDHGSRVMDNLPHAFRAGIITRSDYATGFSTLFAVADGQRRGQLVKVQAPVLGLLDSFVRADERGLSEARRPDDRSIFLSDRLWHPRKKVTLPQWRDQAQSDER